MANLGYIFSEDHKFRDFDAAIYWVKKASESGSALGKAYLGVFYLKGQGVDKDVVLGESLLRDAHSQHNDWAMHNLGLFLFHQGKITEAVELFEMSIPLYRDRKRGVLEFLYQGYFDKHSEARTADFASTAVVVGNERWTGEHVSKDLKKAKRFLTFAAKRGNPQSYYILGIIYRDENAFDEALKWFHEGAKRGSPESNFELALFYATGGFGKRIDQDQKDMQKALQFEKKVQELGSPLADELMKIIDKIKKGDEMMNNL